MNAMADAFSGDNLLLKLLMFTSLIVLYSVFVYYFYKFLAKKNIFELNLNKYNDYEEPAKVKFFAVLFYILEYIIVLPVMTFFWFIVFAMLILVLAQEMSLETILLISAALVASVRITAYISGGLSQELAKLLPLILLGFAITTPNFFNATTVLERAIQIPSLFTNILYYMFFIVAVELFMRVATSIEESLKA
jgi:hypothetical protein